MMLPTHAIVGLAIATPMLYVSPELAPVALAGAFLGSVVPDLDVYTGHRRTLHFPTGYAVLGLLALVVAVVVMVPVTVGVAFFFVGAALHCRMDRYGGGLELRPWEGTSELGVYDHVKGRWLAPKRLIRYDGAPEDLLLTAVLGVPLVFVLEPPFTWLVVAGLLIGGVYTLIRRRMPDIARGVFGLVPRGMEGYVPERFR